MSHVLVPAAIVIGAIGALLSCTGWVLDNYVNSAPARVSRSVLWSGVALLAAAIVLLVGPQLLVLIFARPA